MNLEQRAQMVREARLEMKQDRFIDPYEHNSPSAIRDVRRTVQRRRRVRPGEGSEAYIRRTNDTHGGGDISFAAAARTYDVRRPRGSRPSRRWMGDYAYGYNNLDDPSGAVRPPRQRQRGRAPAYPGRNR